VGDLQAHVGVSERHACQLVGLGRSSSRYQPRQTDDDQRVRTRLRALAVQRRRWGYRRLTVLLRREGWRMNHKRVYRLYRAEGLGLRHWRRKRIARGERRALRVPTGPNQRWSLDFVSDSLADGRRFRALTIVDDWTRECPVIEVDTSLSGQRVVRVLERLIGERGLPSMLVMDNGPEFAGTAVDQWAAARGVTLHFITPGKPVENAYIESFNGKFRDECLNEAWFRTVVEARCEIEAWRHDYNEVRPHSALSNLTPVAFAEHAHGRQTAREESTQDMDRGPIVVPRPNTEDDSLAHLENSVVIRMGTGVTTPGLSS
jgi:putative transposase